MELFPAEAETLRKLISEWSEHTEWELEATFGAKGEVDATRFLAVAQRLKAKGFYALPQEDRLTITLEDHTRFTLNGMGVIQQYCRDNRIAGKPFVAMIKDRAGVESNLDLDDYDTRIKVRREIPLAPDDARIRDILMTWNQQRKAFRLIRRWTFQGQGCQFDLSIVRSTKKDLKGRYIWMKNFLDQDIASSLPIYEIEVELVRGDTTSTPEKALSSLVKSVGEILRGLQKHTLLTRKSTREKVLNAYKTFVGADTFRGVAPITLELKNMLRSAEEGVPNIRQGYNVTDKADGLRVLGFCNEKGELFMLDMALNVYRTGLKKEACKDSLVDGEWVTMTKEGKAIQQLLLFDIYYAPEKKKVDDKAFYSFSDDKNTRYAALSEWTSAWNGGEGAKTLVAGITPATRLQVSTKSFLFAPKDEKQIFVAANQVLSRPTIYNTDGLIFTPNDSPLPQKPGAGFLEQFKWKPSEDNTIDFLVITQKAEDSNEDLLTTAIKPGANDTTRYKTLRLFVGSSTDPAYDNPRDTILFKRPLPTGRPGQGRREYKPVPFNPKDFPDTMASVCYREIELDPDTAEEYIQTERSREPIQDKSIVEMRYDPSQPPGWRWIPIRVRYDKTERLQRGILGRTLNSDKVAESVWNSIHEPITESMIRTGAEQPSQKEMEVLAKTTEEREGIAKKYYERKAPKQDLMLVRGLRDFHNKYIKERILLGSTLREGNKSLLDVSVGKAADLQKWRRAGVGFVMGVDIAGEGIRDPHDGAYRRYLDTLVNARGSAVPPMIFAIGDSSRSLVSGAAGATEEEADILRSVFGRINPVGQVPPYVLDVGKGKLTQGADVVACMFALHYFFKDKDTFQGFMDNLRDTLKVGGYFVACFFDGAEVFELLRQVQKGEAKTGVESDALIWSITKQYDADVLTNDESSFGMPIDVEFISIGTSHREYLVPLGLLENEMRKIGCTFVKPEGLAKLGLQYSTQMFKVSHEMAAANGSKFSMSNVVQQYSFLNRWVIFQRTSSGPMADLEAEEEAASVPPVAAVAPPPPAPASASLRPNSSAWKDVPQSAIAPSVGMAPAPGALASLKREGPAPDVLGPGASAAAAPGQVGSLADAVAEARTLPVKGGPAKKYEANEVFMFFPDAALDDKLKLGEPKGKKAARYLSLYAPFPIVDPTDSQTIYPTTEHFLAGMKYKLTTNKPELAALIFSREGSIHQKFLRDRLIATAGGKNPLDDKKDHELLKQEMLEVRSALRPSNIKKYKAALDESRWAAQKDAMLREALTQRWMKDAELRRIVEKAREMNKYLLHYTGPGGSSDLGGVRKADGTIEGENKVGRILMELAGFPGMT